MSHGMLPTFPCARINDNSCVVIDRGYGCQEADLRCSSSQPESLSGGKGECAGTEPLSLSCCNVCTDLVCLVDLKLDFVGDSAELGRSREREAEYGGRTTDDDSTDGKRTP